MRQPALVDFHVHLDLYEDTELSFSEAKESGAYILSVTTTPSAWSGTSKRGRSGAPRVRTALGLHPQVAHLRAHELPLFDELVASTRYVGEIGLDGSSEYRAHSEVQGQVFEHILASCSRIGGRILTIHSRGAADEVLRRLEVHSSAGTAVLHWFSGTPRQLQRAIDLGCWFSVGPAMLQTSKGEELTRRMPRDRVLTETDGPFARRDRKPLRPGDVTAALSVLARIWGVPDAEARGQVADNLRRLVSESRDPYSPAEPIPGGGAR